jgi:hypothetical protein
MARHFGDQQLLTLGTKGRTGKGKCGQHCKSIQMRAALQINPNDSKCGQHCISIQLTPNAGSIENKSK